MFRFLSIFRHYFVFSSQNLTDFQRLLVLRALRPDRLTVGLTDFVAGSIGPFYVEDMAVPLATSFEDATPVTPVFFILSPGVDPVAFVVQLGRKMGFTEEQDKVRLFLLFSFSFLKTVVQIKYSLWCGGFFLFFFFFFFVPASDIW